MLLKQRLKKALTEIKEISRIDSAVYTDKGEVLAATFQETEQFSERICQFVTAGADALTVEGFHFFKISIVQEENYVLLVRAAVEEAYMIGKLAVCQVRNLIEADAQRMNKSSFMKQVLYGDIREEELYAHAKKLKIADSEWIVYLIKTYGKKEMACIETVRNLFSDKEKDFLIDADEKTLILIKDAKGIEQEEAENIARTILDNVQAEAMQQISVSYGKRAEQLAEITRSYEEAVMAMEIGKIFYGQSSILSFDSLGIGRLVYQIPKELGERFVQEVFGGKEDALDEEDLTTVQRFFDNNLNISETARQMYVHRNTLVYRLERIEKVVGLDVRKFDDAMKFKMALMVRANLDYQRKTDA
ncbi:MAG: PucR family transcriptional regulator [Lachnospiraceae bacterium]